VQEWPQINSNYSSEAVPQNTILTAINPSTKFINFTQAVAASEEPEQLGLASSGRNDNEERPVGQTEMSNMSLHLCEEKLFLL